jgi:hypothetical protein
VKAAPQTSSGYGETVCVAALDEYGVWHRLYPVNFQALRKDQRFGRWDQIEFDWRLPEISKDRRAESKRVTMETISIIGSLRPSDKSRYLQSAIIGSPAAAYRAGKSLALIRPVDPVFSYRKRSAQEIDKIAAGYIEINKSPDLFGTTDIVPRTVSPYEFSYRYSDDDGPHNMVCHDWETEQTFVKWRDLYDEEKALADMMRVFGEEYPSKGMVLALGTHGQRNWQWMIIGVIRLDPMSQLGLF